MVDQRCLEGGREPLSASACHSGSAAAVVTIHRSLDVGAVERRCGGKGHTNGDALDGRDRRVRHQLAEGGGCSRGIGRLVLEGGEGVHRGGALHPSLQGGPRELRAVVSSDLDGVLAGRRRYRARAAVTASRATATRCLSPLEEKRSGSPARVRSSLVFYCK